MARYIPEDQSKLLPVIFSQQITPGTFEHTVTFLIDEHLDMSVFDVRYFARYSSETWSYLDGKHIFCAVFTRASR